MTFNDYDAYLFDLDGVITPTAEVHMRAWKRVFDDVFSAWGIEPAYSEQDYFEYVDGKKRYDGVASLLRSRSVEIPWGDPSDSPEADTVCGIGNRKNDVFSALLKAEGIVAYPGSVRLLDALAGRKIAVVSSSKNAEEVLVAAGLRDRFEIVVDGVVAERDHLASKPDPAMYLRAAADFGVEPPRAVVIEDALSGVASGAAGGFGLVVGVDRGVGEAALRAAGAHTIVADLSELIPQQGAR